MIRPPAGPLPLQARFHLVLLLRAQDVVLISSTKKDDGPTTRHLRPGRKKDSEGYPRSERTSTSRSRDPEPEQSRCRLPGKCRTVFPFIQRRMSLSKRKGCRKAQKHQLFTVSPPLRHYNHLTSSLRSSGSGTNV